MTAFLLVLHGFHSKAGEEGDLGSLGWGRTMGYKAQNGIECREMRWGFD